MSEKVTFDGPAKLIRVETGIISLDFDDDVYSAWKRWIALSDNAKYSEAIRTVGGDPISDVKSLGATFFLLNGWRLKPYEASHRLSINGNVFTDPAGFSIITSTTGSYNVTVEMFVSNLSDSTLAQMAEIEQSMYLGMVSLDTNPGEGTAGTSYPIGTPGTPVSNCEDAMIILQARNLKTVHLHGELLIDHDMSEYTVIGDAPDDALVTVTIDGNVTHTTFKGLTLTGDFGNQRVHITECVLEDITGLSTVARGSTLKGILYIGGTADTSFITCYDGTNPGSVEVNLGGTGRKVEFRDYFGGLKLSNKTGTEECTVNFSAGRLVIASTVTGGSIVVRGVGEISSNLGTATVNDSGLVNIPAIWNAPVASYTTAGTLGAFISKKLLTTGKFLGLK